MNYEVKLICRVKIQHNNAHNQIITIFKTEIKYSISTSAHQLSIKSLFYIY